MLSWPKSFFVIKLALIGKDINHSRSPGIYHSLFHGRVEYSLIDIAKEEDLPSFKDLVEYYRGINITSPYKKSYLNHIDTDHFVRSIGVINCIVFCPLGQVKGTNTDYFAIRDIFYRIRKKYMIKDVFILGDGTMSEVTQFFFNNHNISYGLLSRKRGDDITTMDFLPHSNALIINTCSRSFRFLGKLGENSIFWDYNYLFEPNRLYFEQNGQGKCYLDGLDLLYSQAYYATLFWDQHLGNLFR